MPGGAALGTLIGFVGMMSVFAYGLFQTADKLNAASHYKFIQFDEHYAYAHVLGVKLRATGLYEKYGCYPTSANSLKDQDEYESPEGNSCNRSLDLGSDSLFIPLPNEIELTGNEFHINGTEYKITGLLYETKNNEIIYRAKITNSEIAKKAYSKCSQKLNHDDGDEGVDGVESVGYNNLMDEKNPCGFDEHINLSIYVGKHDVTG